MQIDEVDGIICCLLFKFPIRVGFDESGDVVLRLWMALFDVLSI